MTVIRVSESSYKRLELLARGFDTPGAVIDRLLDYYIQNCKTIPPPPSIIRQKQAKASSRLGRGQKTPSKAYNKPILKALIDLGGKARVHEVLSKVEEEMKGTLNEKDYEPIPSNPNELRWFNTAKWARKDMTLMAPPLLKPDSASGIWEITEAGRKFLTRSDG